MLADDQNFLILPMKHFQTFLRSRHPFPASQQGLMQIELVPFHLQLFIIPHSNSLSFGHSKAETIGIEAFVLIDLLFAVDPQLCIILTIIDLHHLKTLPWSSHFQSLLARSASILITYACRVPKALQLLLLMKGSSWVQGGLSDWLRLQGIEGTAVPICVRLLGVS